jgi:RNA polymerase sigma factor (TIGR02999 family)
MPSNDGCLHRNSLPRSKPMHHADDAPTRSQAEALGVGRSADAAGGLVNGSRHFEELYAELKRLAQRELQRQAGALVSPTTLLHEAWLNLAGREGAVFIDRARFLSYAAKAMRGLTIDLLRERRAQKRGGELEFTSIDTTAAERLAAPERLDDVDEALDALTLLDPALAELVELRFFGGLGLAEIAALRGVSERTVQRDWHKARLLLHHALAPAAPSGAPMQGLRNLAWA